MTKELESKLAEKYPKILRDYGKSEMEAYMRWGFEHGDGWYDLLDKGMEQIQYFCDLCAHYKKQEVQLLAIQIKEKFGTLRFYVDYVGVDPVERAILSRIVSAIEGESKGICENSGFSGCLCKRGIWFRTLSHEEGRKHGFEPIVKGDKDYWVYLDTKIENPEARGNG